MKRTYFDFRFIAGIIIFIVFPLGCPSVLTYGMIVDWYNLSVVEIVLLFPIILSGLAFWYLFGDKLMPTLTVKEDKVIWRCLLFIPVKMRLEDCRYVGLADFSDHNRGPLAGAGITYIYLSNKPLSSKYQHKIDSIRCKKGFIKFAYSDELCKHLSKVLPEMQGRIMGGHYSMMTRKYSAPPKRKKK